MTIRRRSLFAFLARFIPGAQEPRVLNIDLSDIDVIRIWKGSILIELSRDEALNILGRLIADEQERKYR